MNQRFYTVSNRETLRPLFNGSEDEMAMFLNLSTNDSRFADLIARGGNNSIRIVRDTRDRFDVFNTVTGEMVAVAKTAPECAKLMDFKNLRTFYETMRLCYYGRTKKWQITRLATLDGVATEGCAQEQPEHQEQQDQHQANPDESEATVTWIDAREQLPANDAEVWVCLASGEVKKDRFVRNSVGEVRHCFCRTANGDLDSKRFISNGWQKHPNMILGIVRWWMPIVKPKPPRDAEDVWRGLKNEE